MLKGSITYRGVGVSIAVLGAVPLVMAIAADVLGYGGTSGFGRKQIVGASLGAAVLAAGIGLAVRGNKPVSRQTWKAILVIGVNAYVVLSIWSVFHLFTGRASVNEVIDAITFFLPDPKFVDPLDGSNPALSSGSNIFKAGGPEDDFYYFPYGVLGNFPGYTKHPLGFRVKEEIHTFRDNHPNDRLIVLLGGSASYGLLLKDEDTPWFMLEQLLNNDDSLTEYRGNGRFTVLNLSMPSTTVLSEMIYYLLFADALMPDIVIAHDGYNDFLSGQSSDPYFLNNYNLTYGNIGLDNWAAILQAYPKPVPEGAVVDGTKVVNDDLDIIVDSYFTRVAQLKSVAERDGALFVSGLQPQLASKDGLCKWEKPRTEETGFESMRSIYDLYVDRHVVPLESASEANASWIVDFHTAFQRFGADDCVFFDTVHPNEIGNKLIAEIYHSKLRDLITSTTTSTP